MGPPTVLTVVDVIVKNPSESELLYDVIMWISFGFSGRSWIIIIDVNELLNSMLILTSPPKEKNLGETGL